MAGVADRAAGWAPRFVSLGSATAVPSAFVRELRRIARAHRRSPPSAGRVCRHISFRPCRHACAVCRKWHSPGGALREPAADRAIRDPIRALRAGAVPGIRRRRRARVIGIERTRAPRRNRIRDQRSGRGRDSVMDHCHVSPIVCLSCLAHKVPRAPSSEVRKSDMSMALFTTESSICCKSVCAWRTSMTSAVPAS